jgi:hypothetical protein
MISVPEQHQQVSAVSGATSHRKLPLQLVAASHAQPANVHPLSGAQSFDELFADLEMGLGRQPLSIAFDYQHMGFAHPLSLKVR